MGEEITKNEVKHGKIDPANVVLGIKEKIGYSCGGFADNMVMALFTTYMTFFYTDILRLAPIFVATTMLICSMWDAINDPIIGMLADRTNTKWGRYRPWMLLGAPTLILGAIMLFVTLPPSLAHLQGAYTFTATFLLYLWYTIYDIPYSAAVAVITTDYKSRGSIGSYRLGFGNIGNFIVSSSFLWLVNVFGQGDQNKGFFWAAVVCMLSTTPFFIIAFLSTKERIRPTVEKAPSIKESFKALKGNVPFWMIFFAHICWGLHGAGLGARIYYFTYVYGDTLTFGTNVSIWLAGMSCGPIAYNYMMKYTKSKRTPGMIAWLIGGLVEMSTFFIVLSPSNLMFYHVLSFIYGLCGFCGLNAIFACYPDITEYTQKHSGIKATGFLFSFINFSLKAGVTISSSTFTYLLGFLGYTAGAQQSSLIQTFMKGTCSLWMGACLVIGSVLLYFYKIDEKTFNDLLAEIE